MTERGAKDSAAHLSARRLRRRHAAERRFRFYGLAAVSIAVAILAALLTSIGYQGRHAFMESRLRLAVELDAEFIDPSGERNPSALREANYQALVRRPLAERFPEVTSRSDKADLYRILSSGAGLQLREMVLADPSLVGTTQVLWFAADDEADAYLRGMVDVDVVEADRKISDAQVGWLDALRADGATRSEFNLTFFTGGDSREPEQAGIRGAVVGSILTLAVTLLLSFPVGVLAAIYLEEFAPENRWTDLIEVNINNLAAVPSVIFGLLGLAIFLNFMGLPRSAPLVGGMVLAVRTLPIIIIAARAALKAVPPSIREAALGVGASEVQVVLHHVLPLAMPGILTGTIIGMAQALGESAPLLMIGMVAFIVDVPGSVLEPATVLPVQIFIWSDSPERAFVAKTAGAIMVLLAFLIAMNAMAVLLRRRFERRW